MENNNIEEKKEEIFETKTIDKTTSEEAAKIEIDKELKKNENISVNVTEEMRNQNARTIFEFEKTIDEFNIDKLKIYTGQDEEKTVNFLFYDNDFFAVDRVNFKNGYEYNNSKESLQITENLNYKIKKIPNVVKTRKILNIDDIEARIYDVSDYIVLLQKENIKLLKVSNQTDIQNMEFRQEKSDIKKLQEKIDEYKEQEELKLKEENNIKNKFRKMAEKVKYIVVEPFKLLKNKLKKTNQMKMLSDGKHSIFDKED